MFSLLLKDSISDFIFRGICIEMLMQISVFQMQIFLLRHWKDFFLKIEISALKRYLNLKLEICVFWRHTDISIKIIADIFIHLNIYFLMKISVYQ